MPLTSLPTDVVLEIVSLLPLSAIAILSRVQQAWKNFVNSNQENIYHNAAAQHRFIPSTGTSLEDAISSLDFNAVALEITGWKQFCECGFHSLSQLYLCHRPGGLRLTIERNWNGIGKSQMKKSIIPGYHVHYQRPIPSSEYTIVSSMVGGITVFIGPETVWALPRV